MSTRSIWSTEYRTEWKSKGCEMRWLKYYKTIGCKSRFYKAVKRLSRPIAWTWWRNRFITSEREFLLKVLQALKWAVHSIFCHFLFHFHLNVKDSQKCLICERALLSYNANLLQRLKIFECSHAYHEDCLTNSVNWALFNLFVTYIFEMYLN